MRSGKFDSHQPLLLGWDRVMEDLGKGKMGKERLVTEQKVLEAKVKLGLDLGPEGCCFL